MVDEQDDRAGSVRGVLFDADGTLVDSTYVNAVCWWQAFRMIGMDVVTATLHRAIGMGADQLIPHVVGEKRAAELDHDELAAAHDALYSAWWPSLRRLPGARDLLRAAHTSGLTVVLASSAGERQLGVLREVLDADEWIDEATNSDDAAASKPEPDLVHAALDKAGLAADEAVFVGDAVWDVHAAAAAGVVCIGLECGGSGEAELRDAGAAEIYRDPADLLANWDQSIPGRNSRPAR